MKREYPPDDGNLRLCVRCGTWQVIEHFRPLGRGREGRVHTCNHCIGQKQHASYSAKSHASYTVWMEGGSRPDCSRRGGLAKRRSAATRKALTKLKVPGQ